MSNLTPKENGSNLKNRKEILPILGNSKISLAECRKIINDSAVNYSDEELLKLRDWLDNLAEIAIAIIENTGVNEMNEILQNLKRK
ncbi:MAG: hypothetical protein IPP32_02990 [Bacteroidetes bacterium]|nr:hypothetical protein [Bacteroidota bacterium]